MTYIYDGINYFTGFSSDACVGMMDENGFVYNGLNYVKGYGSDACVGMVDDDGFVYNGINYVKGYGSDACVGKVDDDGFVYNGINYVRGYGSDACVGKVDDDGFVYNGINYVNGYGSDACVGRVDNDDQSRAAGAALLLLLRRTPARNDRSTDIKHKMLPVNGSNSSDVGIIIEPPSIGGISGFLSALASVFVAILTIILFLGVPIAAILLGAYLPYDMLTNDIEGFGEYGPIFIFSYGISLIPIWISFLETIFSQEYRAVRYLIILYLIPVIILFVGCIEEGSIGLALLSFVPAIIIFVLPALACLALNGLAYLISFINPISKDFEVITYIGALVLSIVFSVIGGVKLAGMPDATTNRVNEQFGIQARVPEGPLYTSVPLGEEDFEVQQIALESYTEELTRNESRSHLFTVPHSGGYRFEIDDCNYPAGLSIYDENGECLTYNNHISSGHGLRLFGLTEGQELYIVTKATSWTLDYTLLIREDLDISGYRSVTDSIMNAGHMNSYSFTPPIEGNYKFTVKAEGDAHYDIIFQNTNGHVYRELEDCDGTTGFEVYDLAADGDYVLNIYSKDDELSYTVYIYYQQKNE